VKLLREINQFAIRKRQIEALYGYAYKSPVIHDLSPYDNFIAQFFHDLSSPRYLILSFHYFSGLSLRIFRYFYAISSFEEIFGVKNTMVEI
jgi:hypothetical protein